MKFGMLKQFVLTLSILLLSNAAFAWTMTGKIDSLWNGFYYGDNMSFYLEPGWTWAGVSGECGH